MPCSCDHYEPNEREKELNRAAKCYVWVVDKLNAMYESEGLNVCKREVSNGMLKAAKSEWGSGCGDTVAELCHLLNELGEQTVKDIVNNNFTDPMSGQVISWWSKHKEVDKRESVLSSVRSSVWLSKDKEIDGILELNPELENDISKIIAESVLKHQIRKRKYDGLSDLQKAFTIVPDTNRFKRFIKQEHWDEVTADYKDVPKGEQLSGKHYEIAGTNDFYTIHVGCPECGQNAGQWCNRTDNKICEGRKSEWLKQKDNRTRIALGYPI